MAGTNQYSLAAESRLGLPPGSYVYSITSSAPQDSSHFDTFPHIGSQSKLAITCSDDSLRLLDLETLSVVPDGLYPNASRSITALKRFAPAGNECTALMTTGRDGKVQGWDLRSKQLAVELTSAKADPLSALDTHFETNAVIAGTEWQEDGLGQTSIFQWDVRNSKTPVMAYTESHADTVTEVRFLPTSAGSERKIMSGSTDGLVNIYDTTQPDEDDALIQVINHESAIHHTGFIGPDIYVLGTDETLSFYAQNSPDPDSMEPSPRLFGDVRRSLRCQYAIKVLNDPIMPTLCIGSHSEGQCLSFVELNRSPHPDPRFPNWGPCMNHRFPEEKMKINGAHGEEVVRDVLFSPNSGIVLSAGEDGTVRLWRRQEQDDIEMGGMSNKRRGDDEGDKFEKKHRV